jgi:cytosine/adenosine deaminase-related metal-dependent hydrolase
LVVDILLLAQVLTCPLLNGKKEEPLGDNSILLFLCTFRLNKYTFPSEQKFQDTDWAKKVYGTLVRRLLRNGTTTAVYFASIHLEATQILADTTVGYGQRALVGLGKKKKKRQTGNLTDAFL